MNLADFLQRPKWDGHVHIFSQRGVINMPSCSCVGFADIEFDYPIPNLVNLYSKYIDMDCIWLATATNIETIKEIYNQFPNKIKGFGELKLYDCYCGCKVDYKDINFANQVCEFSESVGNLPVYIHFELCDNQDVKDFERLLKEHPKVPIIMCHLGMNEKNQEFAFNNFFRLQCSYKNLYGDISWDAAQYLKDKWSLVSCLDRCIWGSDSSPRQMQAVNKTYYSTADTQWIAHTIKSDRNIEKLFRI